MTTAIAAPPTPTGLEPHRFSEDDFARLIEEGILDEGCELEDGIVTQEGEPYRFSVEQHARLLSMPGLFRETVEMLEGLLYPRTPMNPPHASCLQRLWESLYPLLPRGWVLRIQSDIVLTTSQPLPDAALARGMRPDYDTRHPVPADLGMVAEVSDTTLAYDQGGKLELYAQARIAIYWIVNLIDRQVEVMTQPAARGYVHREVFLPGQAVPFRLDGRLVGTINVDDILPPVAAP